MDDNDPGNNFTAIVPLFETVHPCVYKIIFPSEKCLTSFIYIQEITLY